MSIEVFSHPYFYFSVSKKRVRLVIELSPNPRATEKREGQVKDTMTGGGISATQEEKLLEPQLMDKCRHTSPPLQQTDSLKTKFKLESSVIYTAKTNIWISFLLELLKK